MAPFMTPFMTGTIQAIELREFGAPENMQLITKPLPPQRV